MKFTDKLKDTVDGIIYVQLTENDRTKIGDRIVFDYDGEEEIIEDKEHRYYGIRPIKSFKPFVIYRPTSKETGDDIY